MPETSDSAPDARRVEPVLSPAEWAHFVQPPDAHAPHLAIPPLRFSMRIREGQLLVEAIGRYCTVEGIVDGPDLVRLLALAHAALPDSDPRKLTWERVDMIAASAVLIEALAPIAEALAAYLPPRDGGAPR